MTKPMNAQADDTPQSPAATWYDATGVESPPRLRLSFDLDVDVCVIGGGLAGLTVAREVARRGWSVAVLEADRIANAASGRSSGFVMPGYSEDLDTMIERIGLDHAKELWALSKIGVEYVRDAIADAGMSDVLLGEGWLQVSKTDNWRDLRTKAERLRWIGAEVEAWPVERVREQLVTARYFGALHHQRGFHIDPLNYAHGMARAAEEAGARIFEETPAIELDPAGVRKRVQTPSAKVRATHVVLAANVQLSNLMPRLGATVMPLTTYVMVSEPIANLGDAVRFRGAVSEDARAGAQLRIVDRNRLQISGGVTAWPVRPQLFAQLLRRKVRRLFPQLGPVNVAHLWSGTLGRTLHHMPQIGEVHPGVWISSGFGAHGLNTSALAGQLIGRGIVDADDTWRLFAPYELVWAGGKAFRTVAQAVYLGARPLSGMRAAWSRQRERSRRRSDQRAQMRREKLAAATAGAKAQPVPQAKAPRGRGKGEAAASMLAVPTPVGEKAERKKS